MAIRLRNILKSFFTTGAKPTQSQFGDLIDSFYHKEEDDVGFTGDYGEDNTNTGLYTITMGRECKAGGAYGVAIGFNSESTASYGMAVGNTARANSCSLAVGESVYAGGYAVSIGYNIAVSGLFSLNVGQGNQTGSNAIAVGYYKQALGDGAAAFGHYGRSGGQDAFSAGNNCFADGKFSAAFNVSTRALGVGSFAAGINYGSSGSGAPSMFEACFGTFPVKYSGYKSDAWQSSDRLFVIANSEVSTSYQPVGAGRNAFTMWKTGNLQLEIQLPLRTMATS